MESFSIAIDGSVQNWNPMDMKGWSRALMTGKKLTISLKGKETSVTKEMTTLLG